MKVKIRNAAAGHKGDPGDPDYDSIEGRGTDDDDAVVFVVCWCLFPTTPLCYVNRGPSICDSPRLTMALDVALNSLDSYSKPAELKSRSGTKPGACIASLVDLMLIEHSVFSQICQERRLTRQLQIQVFFPLGRFHQPRQRILASGLFDWRSCWHKKKCIYCVILYV